MATQIILNQLLIFGILIAIGGFAYWRKIITPTIKNNLARIVIDLTLPFLILSTFINIDYESHLIRNGMLVFLLAFINLFAFYWLGQLSSKLLGLKPSQATVHSLHTMLGNIVFLGFPLLDALFPNGIGVFYGAVYQLASNLVTFTFGVYKLSAGTEKSGWKSLINTNTIALTLGILIFGLGITVPSALNVSFQSLGKCTGPLSMVYIGAMLASMNIQRTLLQKSIYVLSINKLLLIPFILAAIFLLVFSALGITISREAFFVLMLQAAMPCQTIVVVLSHRYGGDHQLAGANLFVSTLLSIVTLPLFYFILEWIWTNLA
ncbi:MAG: AEC family transporter [Bacteroidales bacterium]